MASVPEVFRHSRIYFHTSKHANQQNIVALFQN